MTILEAGTRAPEFKLLATPDQRLRLRELRGRPVVLAFYPADWSPVCGDQMALYEHLAFAQQFNAALDLAVAALGDDRRLHDEYGRARLKAERLAGEHAVHRVAFAVVEEALREPYVRRAMRLYSGRPSGGQA